MRAIVPRLGVAADLAPGSPRVDVDEAALKPKNRRSPKCGKAIGSILSSSRADFLGTFSALPINIIPKRKSHCSSREGALWASLATRKFQLWHQGGAWDPRMRRCNGSQTAANCCVDTTCPGNCGLRWAIGRCFIKHGRAKLAHGIGDEYRYEYRGMSMKRVLFLAGVMGLALAQGAQAADMSVQASPFWLPPVNATPDWSGPYIGFNGGYGFGSGSVTGSFFGPIVAVGEPAGLLHRRQSCRCGFRRTSRLQLAAGERGVRCRRRF